MIRRLLKDSAVYISSAALSRAIALLLIPLYTRALAPGDFGVIDLMAVVAGFANLFVMLEIPQAVARYYPAAEGADKARYASTALWFTLASYTAFTAAGLLFAPLLARLVLDSEQHAGVFRIALLAMWAGGIFYFLQNQLRWRLQTMHYALVSILSTLVSSAVAVVLVVVMDMGVVGIFWGVLAGAVAGSLTALRLTRGDYRFEFDSAKFAEMLRFSSPLLVSSIAVLVSAFIDRVAIKQLLTIDDLGIYGIGQRFASAAGLLLLGFQGTLTPLVTHYHAEPATPLQLARTFRYFVAVALPANLALCVYAPEIVILFTAPAYYGAHVIIPLLSTAMLLAGMYVFAPGLWLAKKTRITMQINIAAAAVNIVLNYALIPVWGIAGAAAATLTGALASFALHMTVSQKHYPLPIDWSRISMGAALYCAAVALGGAIDLPLQQAVFVKFAVLTAGSFLIALAVLGAGEARALAERCLLILKR